MDSGERCLFLMKKKQKVLENPHSGTGEQGEDSSSYRGMHGGTQQWSSWDQHPHPVWLSEEKQTYTLQRRS